MFRSGTSNYFFARQPTRFGSQQQNYLEQVETTVASVTDRLHSAVRDGLDLTLVFRDTLSFLGEQRHALARKHRTKQAELHGISRDTIDSDWAPVMITGLYGVYQEYNDRLLPEIQHHLRSMRHGLKSFDQKELKIRGETHLGRRSSMEINIFSMEQRDQWQLEMTRANYERICRLCSVTPKNSDVEIGKAFNELMHDRTAMRTLKYTSIEDYKKIKFCHVMYHIYHRESLFKDQRKSDWVMVTVRHEMHGKMYASSQYLTWMYRNYTNDPVDMMTGRSAVFLVHQDVFLIEDTLQDIAELFKKAIEWNGEDQQTLIDLVALINYEFAHAMPFKRGSAAVGEWLEMAIYRYHGLTLQYKENCCINMEALILPLKQFVEKYPSLINLIPTPSEISCTTHVI